jgi:RHS repeat-associated protein
MLARWRACLVISEAGRTGNNMSPLIELADGGNGDTVQENQYDGRGCRIVTKTYTAGSLTETRHAYFTDQWQCLEERLGASTTPDRQFVWGIRYIDDLILRDRSVGAFNERLYALQDANWNMTAVTDSTGTVQERYEYDPYGVTIVLAPDFTLRAISSFAWETTYCSYRWDAGTGLFAVRHRFYHPRLGAWITPEPLPLPLNERLLPNYSNRFTFDYSNPIVYLDRDGLWPLFAATGLIGAVGGAVIGGALGAISTGTLGGAASGALRGAVLGGITGATLGLIAPAIAGAGVGGALGGAISGATASAVGETATQELEMAIGTRTELDPWQIGTSTAVGTITGGLFCRPALPGSQPVTHWSPQGASPTQLQPTMWVQTGGQTPLNYLKSGTLQLGYPFPNALTQNVPRDALKNPAGLEACKALIGQYKYQP